MPKSKPRKDIYLRKEMRKRERLCWRERLKKIERGKSEKEEIERGEIGCKLRTEEFIVK